jgi:UDP-glucuronate decarboxylase
MSDRVLRTDIEDVAARLGEVVHELAGRTVLLAGARGFLGTHFLELFALLNERVLRKPCAVIALDNFLTSRAAEEDVRGHPHVRFVRHDVIQPFPWDGPLHYVIHAAGVASPFFYRAYPLETLAVSIHGTRNLLELATRTRARFTYFSSSEIYGDPDPKHVPTPESYRGYVASRGPRACYDEGKRVGETLAYVFHESFGTAAVTVRPFNVYGPGMAERDYRVLPNFASRIKAGKPLHVYGSGGQTRTFCYVADALTGFMLATLRGVPGEVYNIGNPVPEVSVLELVRAIERVLGKPLAYDVIEYPDTYPADEPMRRCPDIRKARLQLGYDPLVGLDDGLRRFLAWTDATYRGQS